MIALYGFGRDRELAALLSSATCVIILTGAGSGGTATVTMAGANFSILDEIKRFEAQIETAKCIDVFTPPAREWGRPRHYRASFRPRSRAPQSILLQPGRRIRRKLRRPRWHRRVARAVRQLLRSTI